MNADNQTLNADITPLLAQATETASRWIPAEQAKQAQQEVQQLWQQDAIHIMLFGAYSAGKSTLINALRGTEEAARGETPTTDIVEQYRWGDLVLQDTPGVNAPVEHENITRDALVRADLVLFVIRAGDHDTMDVYRRLLGMIADGKPVMITLNYSAHGEDAAGNVTEIHRAISQNLLRLAPEYGVSEATLEQLTIYPMQFLSALKATLDNKRTLLLNSGLPALSEALTHWAAGSAAQQGRVQAVSGSLRHTLTQPALAAIAEALPQGLSPDLVEARRQLRELHNKKARLHARVDAEAGRQAAQVRTTLADVYGSADVSSQQAVLESAYQEVQQQVFSYMLSELPELESTLTMGVGNLQGDANLAGSQSNSGSQTVDELMAQAKTMLPEIPDNMLSKLVDSITHAPPHTILKPLQNMLQGRAGDFLRANSKYLGPTISVAFGIFETAKAAKDEQRANAEYRAEEARRQQQITGWINQISQGVSSAVSSALDQLLAPHIQQQQEVVSQLEEHASSAETDKQTLLDIEAALTAMQAESQ